MPRKIRHRNKYRSTGKTKQFQNQGKWPEETGRKRSRERLNFGLDPNLENDK